MASIIRRAGAHILKLLQSAADPAAVANQVQVYSKDDGGVAQLFARASDGTISQLTPASAGAIQLDPWTNDDSTGMALNNLGNVGEGSYDWFATLGATTNARIKTLTQGNVPANPLGGWLMNSFEWNSAGQNITTFQTVAADPTKGALSTLSSTQFSTTNTSTITNAGPGGGMGFVCTIPASEVLRTLRAYTVQVDCDMFMRAFLASEGPATWEEGTQAAGAGATVNRRWTTQYKSSRPGDYLVIYAVFTAPHSATAKGGPCLITVD